METLCQFTAPVTMDITADGSIKQHYESSPIASRQHSDRHTKALDGKNFR